MRSLELQHNNICGHPTFPIDATDSVELNGALLIYLYGQFTTANLVNDAKLYERLHASTHRHATTGAGTAGGKNSPGRGNRHGHKAK
jgi:hypothetical protein